MKIKYRTFDDTVYKEIECDDFMYNFFKPNEVVLFVFLNHESKHIDNVCEVYIEEI